MRPHPTLLAVAIAAALATLDGAHAQPGQPAGSPAEVRAEGSAGLVFGHVREAVRTVALPGARISIDGRSAVSSSDGSFRIAGLAPGSYTLRVDYLGYEPVTVPVELGAGSGLRVDVAMTSTIDGATTLDRVEVRATRDAQALALNQQRSTTNYTSVVSADLLGRFPDNNLAEATQRIAGVSISRDQGEGRYVNVRGAPLEFTSVSVDGVQLAAPNPAQRAVELDTISADVISALEVTKAITPDMDGDAIAGQINIVTQSAFDRDRPFIRGSVGAGRYELGSGRNERANLTAGARLGEAGNVGLLFGASGSRAGRFTDNVETVFVRGDSGEILPEVTEIKDYEGERTRRGFTGRLDARIDESNLLYLIGNWSKFRDREYRNTFTLEYENHTAESDETGGQVGRATFDKELRERIQEQTVSSINFGGEHYLGEWGMNWQAAYSRGELELPARQQFIFRSTLRPPLRYDFSNPDFPTWTLLNPDGSVRQEGINLPENLYAFRRYNQRFEQAEENELGLRLDASRAQDFLGDEGELRMGVRARLRDKESNDDRNRNPAGPAPAYTDLLCDRVSNNFGRFEFGRVFCNDIFERFGPQVRNQNLRPLVADSIVGDYQADEDIYAGYLRLDASWDRLTMVTGLRYERTETSGSAAFYDADTDETFPLAVDRDYVKILPSIHFRYEFDPDTLLRWSYSTGISRPNFPNVVPRLVISDDDRSAEAGNPDLKATYSQNLDLSIERYIRPLGLVSAAVFYKRLDDPIFVVSRDIEGGTFDGLRLTQPANGSSGRILGAELTWQQTFDFLPGIWDGLGVYANYTYADSSAELPFGIGSTDLPGTSRHNANLAVFYEKYGFNARLAYNYRSKYIQEFDVGDSELNVFWDERSILDFSTSYQLSGNWQVFGEVNNITDSKQRRFQGQANRVLELEQFGRYWLAGVRFEY